MIEYICARLTTFKKGGDKMRKYRKQKLKALRQMCIKITPDEEQMINQIEDAIALDRFVHKIIMERL